MNLSEMSLLQSTEVGLYCSAGGFYVDPWRPVDRAIVTHAHADHACGGCESYLTAHDGRTVLRARVGDTARIETMAYGEPVDIGGVRVSLHPAGHILGSAQVRLEYRGEVWVVSGDYKTEPDLTCADFEVVRCHTFISESTFGLPVYRWPDQRTVFQEIGAWWQANQAAGKASLILAYALGKSQRILAGLAALGALPGPIYTHGAVEGMTAAYRAAGVALPETTYASAAVPKTSWSRGAHRRAPVGPGHSLDAQVRPALHRLRLRLDAHSRHPAEEVRRSRIRPLRSCRLAQPAELHRSHRSGAHPADSRLHVGGCPLAPGAGQECRGDRHPVYRRTR